MDRVLKRHETATRAFELSRSPEHESHNQSLRIPLEREFPNSRSFQAFRWKAGPQGRFKDTIVCREVAVEKNICQACLSDMTFGVPVGVRDALLGGGVAIFLWREKWIFIC